MNKPPRFSFVVPVRNGWKTLGDTLRSIERQSHRDFEVIVVDNGSTDGTRAVARKFPKIRYVHHADTGRARARNAGARCARGEYLAFVDADVLLDRDWLEQARLYLRRVPCDALATRIEPFGTGSNVLDEYRRRLAIRKTRGTFLSVAGPRGPLPLINTAACLISRSAFERTGGFQEVLPRHEDFELSMRLFWNGFLLGGASAARARVRFSAGSALPGSRELAYLRRAFEVQYLSLPMQKSAALADMGFLRSLRRENPAVLGFAALVELTRASASLANRMAPSRVPQTGRRFFGRSNLLSYVIRDGRDVYLPKENAKFLFIDDQAYLLRDLRRARKLGSAAARAVIGLKSGRGPERGDARALLKAGSHLHCASTRRESRRMMSILFGHSLDGPPQRSMIP